MKLSSKLVSISLSSAVLGLIACGEPAAKSKDLRRGVSSSAVTAEKNSGGQAADDEAVYLVSEADVDAKVSQAIADPEATTKLVMTQAAEIAKPSEIQSTEIAPVTTKAPESVQTVRIASAPAATAPVETTTQIDKQSKIYQDIHSEFMKKLQEKPGSLTQEDVDYLSEHLAGFVQHGGKKSNKEAAAYWNKFAKRVHELAKVRAEKKMGIFPILFGLGALVAAILAPATALVAAVAAPVLIAPVVAAKAVHNVIAHVFRVVG